MTDRSSDEEPDARGDGYARPVAWVTRRAAFAMLCATAALGGCSMLFPARYRYRMTVEVDTPAGPRRGFSVREISSRLQSVPGRGGPTPMTKFKGEAVAVDLPNGRTLFALIDESINVTSIFEPDDRTPELFVANVVKLGRGDQHGRTVVLSADNYPRLVTFRDIRDPTSVQEVDPAHLAASFGPGVRLRRIMLEITGDGVTSGIQKRLPDPYPNGFFNWDGKTEFRQSEAIAISDFTKGVSR